VAFERSWERRALGPWDCGAVFQILKRETQRRVERITPQKQQQQQRRRSTKLRIEQHKVIIHYLGISETTSFSASDFVQPGALRRYRLTKGKFTLTWRILLTKLQRLCGFDETKHVLVSAAGTGPGGGAGAFPGGCVTTALPYAARVVKDDKGLNAAFRAQIAWFKKSDGDGTIVFWALLKDDLKVRRKEVLREAFLAEAGVEIADEDGVPGSPEPKLVRAVETWSEGVVEECIVEEGVVEEGVRGGLAVRAML
jgi:hypothetical protein